MLMSYVAQQITGYLDRANGTNLQDKPDEAYQCHTTSKKKITAQTNKGISALLSSWLFLCEIHRLISVLPSKTWVIK